MSKRSKDTWLYFSAGTIGAALLCTLLTSWSSSTRAMIVVMCLGLTLVGLSQWKRKSRSDRSREIIIDTVGLVVDAESRAEILFSPVVAAINPKLFMSAHGRPVVVEDAWHEGVSILPSPRAVAHWRKGVVYKGVVDSKKILKILLHNQGFTPAMVHAKLVVSEDERKRR